MAITLNPTVASLGIMAPVLGPWFSDPAINLGVPSPGQNLGLTVSSGGGTSWFAPSAGTLSLFVSNGAAPPAALAPLQDATGAWPFPNGRIIAFFRLLPEIEARLHELVGLIPPASATTITSLPTATAVPARPQVRSLAVVLPSGTPLTPAGLYPFLGGTGAFAGSSDPERMTEIGLAISSGTLVDGALPMTALVRAGGSGTSQDKLLQGLMSFDLWAFDRRGRAIDPGAVACWWSWLLNTAVGDDPATGATDLQLLAPSIASTAYPQQAGQPVVAEFADQRTAHLVDAHEGPLGAPFLNGRLQVGGSLATTNLVQVSGNSSVALTFSALPAPGGAAPPPDNPQVDDAPRARMAILPTGTYATTATAWPNGPVHAALTRDFVRIAVVDEESHLVGVTRRDSRATVTTPDDRRRSAQNRPSTRINVGRTAATAGVLLANGQLAADALLAVPNATTPSRLVLGIGDVAWGGTPTATPPAPGLGPLPTLLNDAGESSLPTAGEYRVRALVGGGASSENRQTVLVEVNLGAPGAGSWIRAWPLGFDVATGLHFRITGGAGRADAAGVAQFPMLLANGLVGLSGLMGMDVLVLLPGAGGAIAAQREYADRRFARPAAAGGTAPTTVTGSWLVCETAATGSGALPAGAVPPGGHVILTGAIPAIVDRTTLPTSAMDANTLRNRLQATDIVSLTSPAFAATPDRADATGMPMPRLPATGGDPTGGIGTVVGTRLHRLDRTALTGATASSVPYALLDRLEVAAATVATGATSTATAAIGADLPAPWALEPGANQHLGHPGVPASIETHGAGVSLTGAPAVAVAEYVRERTAGLSFTQVQGLTDPVRSAAVQSELAVAAEAAANQLPAIADGAGAGPVVAVLRTAAFGMDGVPGVAVAATSGGVFPLSQNEAALEAWLNGRVAIAGGAGSALRSAAAGPMDSMTRALDRRLLTSAFGAREALTTLVAAIGRAQDLIYLETPAVDDLAIDSGGESIRLWQQLLGRLATRKGLCVVLCVPSLGGRGTPRALQVVRDHCLLDAVEAIRAAAGDRFALFSPGAGGGREIRFASTSVVIDDALALTGTTHLWRRGLSWDSSLAAAVFDERLVDGRPQDVRSFRIQLLADRLGIPITRVPDDPAELVKAIRDFDTRGSSRLAARPIVRPDPAPGNGDIETWDPDGSKTTLDLTAIEAAFAAAIALTTVDHAIVEG